MGLGGVEEVVGRGERGCRTGVGGDVGRVQGFGGVGKVELV